MIKGLTNMRDLPFEYVVAVRCDHFAGERYLAHQAHFCDEVTADVQGAKVFTEPIEATRAADRLAALYSGLNVEVRAEVLHRKVIRMNGIWEPLRDRVRVE